MQADEGSIFTGGYFVMGGLLLLGEIGCCCQHLLLLGDVCFCWGDLFFLATGNLFYCFSFFINKLSRTKNNTSVFSKKKGGNGRWVGGGTKGQRLEVDRRWK